MTKKLILVGFILFIGIAGRAQQPGQLLNTWSAKSPIEKVYLHLDRDNYIAGETAWFKAYLFSDYQPDTISTSLYVELVSDSRVVTRSILPVVLGTATGQFDIPDSLPTGSYLVRAYSVTMLNQGDFTGKQYISVHGRKKKNAGKVKEKIIRLEFFPEGGNLINGFSNTVAFKATDENGLPAAINGRVVNEINEAVTTFTGYHDGMGMFELTPVAGGKYYALLEGDVTKRKYPLPASTDKGIALTVIPHPQGSFFELKQRKDDPAFHAAYMIGQMQHRTVFRQDFKTFREDIHGVINTQHLHSGILQITFFNKDDQPLAERLCFVDNKEYIQKGELITDTVNFSPKGKNRFSILLKDTIMGSFSVSITDPAYSLLPLRQENIFSSLLLTSDLKGYIHNPAFYFYSDNDSVKTALDLVMMTNGWRRFKWSELPGKATQAAVYKDPAYITLTGKVTLRGTKKPFAEKPLLLLLITADSTRSIQMISTDKQGNFRLDSMLFFGKSSLFFSDTRGKKNQYIDVQFSADTLTKLFPVPLPLHIPDALTTGSSAAHHPGMELDYDALLREKGLLLEGVTVKARKKSAIEELEEKYASGMFSGGDNRTIDLVSTKETGSYTNIFEYLQLRMPVPGLSIMEPNSGDVGSGYRIYYRQGMTTSASSSGPIPMVLYLNETETDADVISTIPADQIAMVKVFSSFAGSAGNGAGGVLAIYTKKGADLADAMQHTADMVKYNGYTVTKEVYAPDYAVEKPDNSRPDKRITLDWRPDILVSSINPSIPLTFFNNDRTKEFRIVVEGMTWDGKLLSIEKIISR